ncbi:hypothetical protein BpHYR1_010360 [Brachionus plicatilis]|uniref:Uncharacterized protein n=1 Tax=Brachionus plicatilis TaxID=10195 RepID=A0A3M7PFL3_BRAPC|nr:hypothetical protein BpHYR1_010360 [Brachionus plicatilis]
MSGVIANNCHSLTVKLDLLESRITYILSQYHSVFVCLEKKKNPDLSKFREKNPKKQNCNLDNFFKIDQLRLHLFLTNGHDCFLKNFAFFQNYP